MRTKVGRMLRKLEYLAPQIYLFPRNEIAAAAQPNIGIIRLEQQTILVDAGNSPRHARQVLAAMAVDNLPPVKAIIYTHHHWDHTFGAATYQAPMIIAHDTCAAILDEYAGRIWNAQALREAIFHNPRLESSYNPLMDAVSDWREFRIAKPTVTFSRSMTLVIEGVKIQLTYTASSHAPDSIIVRLPQSGVMFTGDAAYPPPSHLREDDNSAPDYSLVEALLAENFNIYMDGHGPPRTHGELADWLAVEKRRQSLLGG